MLAASGQIGISILERNGFLLCSSCSNPSSSNVLLISPKPLFCAAVNVDYAKRMRSFCVRIPRYKTFYALSRKELENCAVSDRFIEKELKFKPAFDDYLKVMESLANDEMNGSSQGIDGYHSKKSLAGEDNHNENGSKVRMGSNSPHKKNVATVESEDYPDDKIDRKDQNMPVAANLVENDGDWTQHISSRGRLGYKQRERNLGNVFSENRHVLSDKVSGTGKVGDSKRKMSFAEYRKLRLHPKTDDIGANKISGNFEGRKLGYSNADSSLDEKNGKWSEREVNLVMKVGNLGINKSKDNINRKGHGGKYDGLRKDGRLVNVNEGGYGYHKDEANTRKKQWQQDGRLAKSQIDNAKRKMDRHITEKKVMCETRTVFKRESFHASDDETDLDKHNNNDHTSEGVSSAGSMDEGKAHKSRRNIYEIGSGGDDDDEVYADEMEINTSSHGRLIPTWYLHDDKKEIYAQNNIQGQAWLHENVAGVKKSDLANAERHGMLRGEYFQTKKNEKVIGPDQLSMEDDNHSGLWMQRKAFETFEVFMDVRNRPRVLWMEMEERINKLAKWLNGTDVNLPEWQFSKMMHSAKIKFTDHSILRVVQILGDLGNWRRALQVVEWLHSRERFKSYKSKYIYTTLLDVLGKAKRPVEALNLFHSMQNGAFWTLSAALLQEAGKLYLSIKCRRQQLSSYPDLAAYHCIAVTLGQAGYLKELFDVIDCMRTLPAKKFKLGMLTKWDPRLEPDIVVYNAVLNACAHRKKWEGAFWVLQQLKQQNIPPSSTTYGLVMEVMFACGKYNLVHEFFRKVEKKSMLSALDYKVLVNALWREGKTDEAVLAVQDMERRGIVGSASLYYDLARCLCSAGRCQEALQQVDKICKVAKKPLVVTYTGLMQACLDSGNVQNGAYIFIHMQKFCPPNIVTCNIMLKAYIEHGMIEEAKDLFQRLLKETDGLSSENTAKERVLPDRFTFNTMLEACISRSQWGDFEHIYQQMLLHGYHFNPKRHLWMILEASKAGQGQMMDMTWHHLVQSSQPLPLLLVKERFCLKLQEGNISAALSCICSYHTNDPHTFSKKTWLNLFNDNADRFTKDTIVILVDKLSTTLTESDGLDSRFENLVSSCEKFLRMQK